MPKKEAPNKQQAIKTQEPEKGYKQPNTTAAMKCIPELEDPGYTGSAKLTGQTAFLTGADSGIGAAAAIAFAKEGCNVAIGYLHSKEDAQEVVARIQSLGGKAIAVQGDVGREKAVQRMIDKVVKAFGGIDILVNNAAEQHPTGSIEDISAEQLERTFRTNIFSMFYLVKAALPHMPKGARIINTTSLTAYRGDGTLLDYSSTKGAIVSFTRSLALNSEILAKKIRVNAVSPGPIWTPLIPSTFPDSHVKKFGKDVPMKRPAQPYELAATYVYLASADSSYVTGQVLHVNGGMVVNG